MFLRWEERACIFLEKFEGFLSCLGVSRQDPAECQARKMEEMKSNQVNQDQFEVEDTESKPRLQTI